MNSAQSALARGMRQGCTGHPLTPLLKIQFSLVRGTYFYLATHLLKRGQTPFFLFQNVEQQNVVGSYKKLFSLFSEQNN